MHIDITEEDHNRVTWQGRNPLVRILIGVLVGVLFLVALVVPSPSPARWAVTAGLVVLGLVIATILALTTPLADGGALERLPDGGEVQRIKAWLFIGNRPALSVALNDITAFEVEGQIFDDAAPATYGLARLWAIDTGGARISLTGWADPESVSALGEALARAGRREMVRVG
jgi:hypothetical protein